MFEKVDTQYVYVKKIARPNLILSQYLRRTASRTNITVQTFCDILSRVWCGRVTVSGLAGPQAAGGNGSRLSALARRLPANSIRAVRPFARESRIGNRESKIENGEPHGDTRTAYINRAPTTHQI